METWCTAWRFTCFDIYAWSPKPGDKCVITKHPLYQGAQHYRQLVKSLEHCHETRLWQLPQGAVYKTAANIPCRRLGHTISTPSKERVVTICGIICSTFRSCVVCWSFRLGIFWIISTANQTTDLVRHVEKKKAREQYRTSLRTALKELRHWCKFQVGSFHQTQMTGTSITQAQCNPLPTNKLKHRESLPMKDQRHYGLWSVENKC